MSEQITTKQAGRQPAGAAGAWPADPVAYLQTKGWTPCGDPRYPGTSWLDPAKPEKDTEEWEVVGQRTKPNREVEEIKQLRITPRAFPVSLEDAVTTQLERDRSGRR